jgi:glycosyltransferase involved in cell wall biosynthesis
LLDGVQIHRKGRFPARWRNHRHWDRFALWSHARQLLRAARASRNHPIIAIVFHPLFEDYLRFLQPQHVAFHVYDDYARMDRWSSADQQRLERLTQRADLITAATAAMIHTLPPAAAARAILLPNGGDFSRFAAPPEVPCPPELAAIPHPRIGNLGTLNRKMDLPLIAALAQRRPDWHWVLVGKVEEQDLMGDPPLAQGLADCRRCANVHFLGHRNRLLIPTYAHHLDVHTVAYRIRDDDYVVAGYPVKLNEYLATGKPVVSAAQQATLDYFSDVVAVASGVDQWETALAAVIAGLGVGTVAQRQAVARSSDWSVRVDQLETMLLNIAAGNHSSNT